MSAIEQKIITLFSPLPFSLKAKIVAALSQMLAKEASEEDDEFLQEDLETSIQVRQMISEGEMELLSEEEGFAITDELIKKTTDIEARHASGKGKTYSKEEFRKQLDDLMAK